MYVCVCVRTYARMVYLPRFSSALKALLSKPFYCNRFKFKYVPALSCMPRIEDFQVFGQIFEALNLNRLVVFFELIFVRGDNIQFI